MARKRRVEEYTNHERWLVSYADFITLLFAFFVVMYSISSVNEDKYRVLSDAMVSAFREPAASTHSARVAHLAADPQVYSHREVPEKANEQSFMIPMRKGLPKDIPEKGPVSEIEDRGFSERVLDAAEDEVNTISDGVETRMQASIDDDLIDVKRNKFWLEVEIKSSLLFESGSSELIPTAVPLLVELSELFADLPNRIHIEGFTDNKPINNAAFPSNWELSSARAAAVVRLFERNGVEPSRLASIGYGEYQPITDNDSEDSRAKNRRVVIVVMAALEGQDNNRIHEFELLKDKSVVQTDY